jgi:hypothetical protein
METAILKKNYKLYRYVYNWSLDTGDDNCKAILVCEEYGYCNVDEIICKTIMLGYCDVVEVSCGVD